MGNLSHRLRLGRGGSSLAGSMRATWKHLGALGAGVVSGVNAASAAGSDRWLGSPSKSAPLPGTMEGKEGFKGDHSSFLILLHIRKALETIESAHHNRPDTEWHNTYSVSFTPAAPDLHPSPGDPEHFHLTIIKDITRAGYWERCDWRRERGHQYGKADELKVPLWLQNRWSFRIN